jgi:hypothetical protein
MFELQDSGLQFLEWLAVIVKLASMWLNKGGDPDETEVEPDP